MSDVFERDEELDQRQDGRLHPLGHSLRRTFPPRDGEELQSRITSLMVELSHLPYERQASAAIRTDEAASPTVLHHFARFFRRKP